MTLSVDGERHRLEGRYLGLTGLTKIQKMAAKQCVASRSKDYSATSCVVASGRTVSVQTAASSNRTHNLAAVLVQQCGYQNEQVCYSAPKTDVLCDAHRKAFIRAAKVQS